MTLRSSIEKVLSNFCIATLLFITIIILLDIIFRYFLSGSFGWPQELSTHIIVWTTYTGIGIGISKKELIKIDVVFNKLNKLQQNIILIINEIVMMLVMGYLLRYFISLYSIQSKRVLASLNLSQSIGISGAIVATAFLEVLVILNIRDYVRQLKGD